FQTWSDKAGNAPPLTAVDPVTGVSVTFPDLNASPFGGEDFQTNLIMPEPCRFLRDLPVCSIIRPTNTNGIAAAVVKFLTDMGLFRGQSQAFFAFLNQLAAEADAARTKDRDGELRRIGRCTEPCKDPQGSIPCVFMPFDLSFS